MNDPHYPDALPNQYRLHWYVLERVLGQGGFGITYLARDSNLDKLVAIKEYLPVDTATRRSDSTVSPRAQTQAERYSSGLEGFIREARTLARFSHPHIVRVHSVFQHNNTAYMVMEFEEGETLAALLERRQTLTETELLDVLLPVIDGLTLVHAAGFIHRDIKPENILIRKDGSPVLLDFGSARAALGHSRTMTILVAPGYAPYEQYYANGDSQGPWTDIYGLGATCYRAIAGEAPMDAIARSKGVLGSTREMLVPASERGARRYSPAFLAAVDHALAFAERDRPQTLAQWRRELRPDSITAVAESAPAITAAPAPALVPTTSAGLREVIAWTGLGAALTALAVLLWPRWFVGELPAASQGPASATSQAGPVPATSAAVAAIATALPAQGATSTMPVAPSTAQASGPAQAPVAAQAVTTKALVLPAPTAAAVLREPARTPAKASVRPAPAAAEITARPAAGRGQTSAPPTVPEVVSTPSPAAVVAAPAPSPAPAATGPTPAPSPAPAAMGPASATAPVVVPVAAAAPAPAPVAPRQEARPAEAAPPTEERAAFAYYRERALKGDGDARFRLGEMYVLGKGVTPNMNQAYLWFGLAAKAGHRDARARQAQVAERLQPAEVRQADRQIERLGQGNE